MCRLDEYIGSITQCVLLLIFFLHEERNGEFKVETPSGIFESWVLVQVNILG